MTPLKKIILVILLLPIVLVVVSLFLPGRYRVERRVEIKAKPELIFSTINNLKTWPEWTAWTVARYPDMKVSFSGPETGSGAAYTWEGRTSGRGSLKLTSADPARGITYDLDFENGKYLSKGTIILEPYEEVCGVVWRNEGDLGWNPVSRYFGLLMDKMMGADLQTGLRNLQNRLQEKPSAAPPEKAAGSTNQSR